MAPTAAFGKAGPGMSTAPSARASRKAGPRLLFRLSWLIVLLLVCLSPMMLARFGIRYDLEGGTVLEKIHPAHWLALLTIGLVFAATPRPRDFLDRTFTRHKGSLVFLATWVLLLFHVIVVQKQAFTPIIDTFLLPVEILLIVSYLGFADRLRLAHLVHFLMFANALLGIVEVASGFRLTPLDVGGMVLEEEWRASALIGHPLANALLTGFYLITIALGGWRGVPWALRPVIFLTCLVAMNAFGGRAAFSTLLAFLLVIFVLKSIGTLRGERSPRRNWVLAAVLIPSAIALVVLGVEFGMFDRFIERFVSDKGSASARVIILDIMRDLTWFDLLIGPDPELMATLLNTYGLHFGIESFWIAYILSYGAIVSLIFFAGLAAFIYDVVRTAGSRAFWPLLYFFIVCSTYVSLSAKSTDFALAVAIVVVLISTAEDAGARRTAPAASGAPVR